MKRLALIFLAISLFIIPVLVTSYVKQNVQGRQDSIDPNKLSEGYIDGVTKGIFHGAEAPIPPKDLYEVYAEKNLALVDVNVLGTNTKKKEKRIEIDLSKQKLYGYEGSTKKYSFSISSGKWYPTPTGDFRIWTKLKYSTMTGGSKELGTYYNLPNVPYTMYFYNSSTQKWKGFGIHGAYWHNNFGHPMSHGCVNMKPEDAKVLFDWARSENQNGEGTKVKIYGNTPNN